MSVTEYRVCWETITGRHGESCWETITDPVIDYYESQVARGIYKRVWTEKRLVKFGDPKPISIKAVKAA